MSILLVHGAGYESDEGLRYLQRQRLRSGLTAGFIGAKRITFQAALGQGPEAAEFGVRMTDYSEALNSTRDEVVESPPPVARTSHFDWQPLPKARCLCCPRTRRIRTNVRDWAGNVSSDMPNFAEKVATHQLPDVPRYLQRDDGRGEAIGVVKDAVAHDVTVVIGHSLGSVVTIDALARLKDEDSPDVLVTIGSPLRHELVRRNLDAATVEWIQTRQMPWINVYDRGDVVTGGGSLPLRNYPGVVNVRVSNGDHPHAGDYYLRHPIIGALIWDLAIGALAPDELRTGIPPTKYGNLFRPVD